METIIFSFIVICAIIFSFRSILNSTPETANGDPSAPKPAADEGDNRGFYCKIAGVAHHCDESDIGAFIGIIKPEPENPHDPNACAVYDNEGKLVGYIPAARLQDYREWSGLEEQTCIGYVRGGVKTPLFGCVKAIKLKEQRINAECADYIRWMLITFGMRYLPKGLEISGHTPRTKKAWIDLLDYIVAHNS